MASPNACPICKKAVAGRAENAAFPFCSARCKTIDLGKWLDEAYRVPAEESDAGSESSEESPAHPQRN